MNVFETLGIRLTRDQWRALCEKNGCDLPYPFKTELRVVK